jgi:hypothetical protein
LGTASVLVISGAARAPEGLALQRASSVSSRTSSGPFWRSRWAHEPPLDSQHANHDRTPRRGSRHSWRPLSPLSPGAGTGPAGPVPFPFRMLQKPQPQQPNGGQKSWHVVPEGQHRFPRNAHAPGHVVQVLPLVQHWVWPNTWHACEFAGHSHWQVLGFRTVPLEQKIHVLVFSQRVPGGQVHWPLVQVSPWQHSELSRHCWPASLHRPGNAAATGTLLSKAPAASTPARALRVWRRDTPVASSLVNSSKPLQSICIVASIDAGCWPADDYRTYVTLEHTRTDRVPTPWITSAGECSASG